MLAGPLAATLSNAAAEHGATIEALAHAAWCTVLARSVGAEEATVSYVGAERRHADLEGAIGAISRSVPLSTGALAGITFPELLEGLTRARADSLVWQDYAPADSRAGFATGFVAAAGARLEAGGSWLALERVIDTGRGFALALTCTTGDGEPRLELCFDPECHDRESVKRLGRRLERTLQAVASDPGQVIAAIDLLDDAERHRLLVEFNDTSGPVPTAAVHELFAHHATASPSRAAAIDEHGPITYAELDARANQLANRLRASAQAVAPPHLTRDLRHRGRGRERIDVRHVISRAHIQPPRPSPRPRLANHRAPLFCSGIGDRQARETAFDEE